MAAPNVSVSVVDQSVFNENFPSNVPLFILATESNKPSYDGTGIALGTTESHTLRAVTGASDAIALLGKPMFTESAGVPVHGDEANEYGAWALWHYLKGGSSLAYYTRADIDMKQLQPSSDEPTRAAADGTYWIDTDATIGGFYRRNSANTAWEDVTFNMYTVTPTLETGDDGDIAFDYSNTDGTVMIKRDTGGWTDIGSIDLSSTTIDGRTATSEDLWISDTAPLGASANDYWWKTSAANGGYDLKLSRYRASDDTWVKVTPLRSLTEPITKTASTVWEDVSTTVTNGVRVLNVSNGETYGPLTFILDTSAPTRAAIDGQMWYDDTFTDFALYREVNNEWSEVETTTVANPTADQKVISASPPITPSTGAIWVDVAVDNFDQYPVIKRYNGSGWENITSSVDISATYIAPSAVADGSFWLNLDDPRTTCTVKVYDSEYQPEVIDDSTGEKATYDEALHGHWKPFVGARFLRRAQRFAVSRALQAAISDTNNLDAEAIFYTHIAAPGYPELIDEMVSLNTAIEERAHISSDIPFHMKPSGITKGREITATEWKTNANLASENGVDGFTSSTTPYGSWFYMNGLSTNIDGQTIFVPASANALRLLAYNDQVAAPWFAPMGDQRGLVSGLTSVGYLDYNNEFKAVNLNKGQSAILYDNNINPVVNQYRVGLRSMGNKTMYGGNTMLSRINVARLVSKIKYDIKVNLRPFLGAQNDAKTWGQVRNIIDRYLAGLITQRALYDSVSRCDENTNTAERITRNELWAEIGIKPIGAVEFIFVPITVYSPDADF